MVFGTGLEHQSLIAWDFVLLQLLHSPLPYRQRRDRWTFNNVVLISIFRVMVKIALIYEKIKFFLCTWLLRVSEIETALV